MTYSPSRRTALKSLAAAAAFATLLSACAGEGSGSANASGAAGGGDQNTVTIDYATYNPLSLIIRKKGWLETALAAEGKKVEWVKSAGSNKANEALRSGNIDVGSRPPVRRRCWHALMAPPSRSLASTRSRNGRLW